MIIWYPVLFCLYLISPILLRKLIVLKTYLWMLPFIWNRLIVAWEIKQKLHKILMLRFFETPCIDSKKFNFSYVSNSNVLVILGPLKKWGNGKFFLKPRLQNIIQNKNAYKRWTSFLKNWGSYSNFCKKRFGEISIF